MNLTPLTPFERQLIELGTLHREALARRLAEDKQIKLSKITEAASRRMELFRAQQDQDANTGTLITGAASSPDSDLSSESESSLDSA